MMIMAGKITLKDGTYGYCPFCGSGHLIKAGMAISWFTDGKVQRYQCLKCKRFNTSPMKK